MAKILIVDDEESVRKILSIQLKRLKHSPFEAENGAVGWRLIQENSYDVIITDLKMPEMDGLELLGHVRRSKPEIPVIMITAHGTIDTAVEAMKRGAFDYVTKPFNHEEFLKTIERAVKSSKSMQKEFQRSRAFLKQDEKIIGTTEKIEQVYSIIEGVADSASNVLITGAAGTGKEVVVRLLHDKSSRKKCPLVRAHISACPSEEQEERLFGGNNHPGWFDLAENGSLYLDEVGALSLEAQAKLYDALTTGTYNKNKKVKCRIIAASDYNLLEQIEQGGFRKDLFYCLNVVPIYLPALKERTQDIEPLVDHFMKVFSKKFNKQVELIDDEALFHLIQYPWPGNIRELENSIEYAVNVADDRTITKDHLPGHLFSSPVATSSSWNEPASDILKERVNALEKDAIKEALKSSKGDVLVASQKLGVPPSLLEAKLAHLKISTSN